MLHRLETVRVLRLFLLFHSSHYHLPGLRDVKRVFKFNRNRLFRGHEGDIAVETKNDNKNLIITNTYYGGYCKQVINLNNATAEVTYCIHRQQPKWFGRLLDEHLKMVQEPGFSFLGPVGITVGNDKYRLDSHTAFLITTETVDISNLQGHMTAINKLKVLSKKLSYCIKQFKSLNAKQLEDLIIPKNDGQGVLYLDPAILR